MTSTTTWRQFIKEKHNAEIWDVDVHDVDCIGDGCAGVCSGFSCGGWNHKLGGADLRVCDCPGSGTGGTWPGKSCWSSLRFARTQSGGTSWHHGRADSWTGVHRIAGAVHAGYYFRKGSVGK